MSPDVLRSTVEQISSELNEFYQVEGLEEVRVIRDRQTSKLWIHPLEFDSLIGSVYSTEISRKLGFLRFHDLDYSRAFLEPNYPSVYFYGPNSSGKDGGTRVRIAYSREREDRARSRAEGDWTCRMVRLSV